MKSENEMMYGLIAGFLAGLVFFLSVAAMWQGSAGWGYLLMALSVCGLLRSARHVRHAYQLGAAEDAARARQWREWEERVLRESGVRSVENRQPN